jgi:hypothetical protein
MSPLGGGTLGTGTLGGGLGEPGTGTTPVTPTTTRVIDRITGLTIVADAFAERNVFDAGSSVPPEDAAYGRRKMNRILDLWNADHGAAYGALFTQYQLSANLQPHTIGPTGTFVVSARPQQIEGAWFVTGTGESAIRSDIGIGDKDWWGSISMQGFTTEWPTALYYHPNWPNGELWITPIPSTAGVIELMTTQLLANLALTDVFSMPFGYQEALTLTLAESLRGYGSPPPDLAMAAAKARAKVFNANLVTPRLTTRDSGMPGGGGGWYDYRTGTMRCG